MHPNSRPRSTRARAAAIVRYALLPVIASALKLYPELDEDDVLERCVLALTERLSFEIEDVLRAHEEDIRERLWPERA